MSFPTLLRRAILPAAAVLLAGAAIADTRQITGDLAYRERIALLPGATMLVELRDETGTLVGALREEAGERQVPLPFALEAPGGALTLQGGLVVAGAPIWASEPVAIPAGDEDVTLGVVQLRRVVAMGFATTFRCGEAEAEVGFLGEGARLRIGATFIDLAPVPAASGARFEAADDPGTWVWSKGNEMTVSFRGTELPLCFPALSGSLVAFTARGNEPFWTLRVEDGTATFRPMDGAEVSGPVAAPEISDGARRYEVEGTDLAFIVRDRVTRDTMTGMPHPAAVTIETGEATLTGTGGDPAALLGGVVWRAEDVAGKGIPDAAEVTLEFRDGRAAGTSGCNRYSGGYTLSGEGLGFDRMAGTMMLCPDALMTLERDYLDALARVTRFEIDDTGALVLIAGDDPVALLRH